MKYEKRKPVAVQEARFGIEWVIRGKAEEMIYHYKAEEDQMTYEQFVRECVYRGKAVGWEFVRCFMA